MNERIRVLWLQAAREDSGDDWDSQTQFIERFAKLIIQECVQTLRDNTPVVDEHDSVEEWDRGYIRAMVDCEHHIEEHFGVE